MSLSITSANSLYIVVLWLVCAFASEEPTKLKEAQFLMYPYVDTDVIIGDLIELLGQLSPEEIQSEIDSFPNIESFIKTLSARSLEALIPRVPNLDKNLLNLNPTTLSHIYQTVGDQMRQYLFFNAPMAMGRLEFYMTYGYPNEESWDHHHDSYPQYHYHQYMDHGHYHGQNNELLLEGLRPNVDSKSILEIFRTMPSIPKELADSLYLQEPGFVQYIISNHTDLTSLLLNMHPYTLEYVLKSDPNAAKSLSKLSANDLRALLYDLPTTDAILKTMDPQVLKVILFKVPELKKFAPQ